MLKPLRLLLPGTLLSMAFHCAAWSADTSVLAASIDKVAQEAIAAGESPGLQVAVYKDGAPVLVKAYGSANLELNAPVNNDSVFRIGSITKQFTAVALLKLEEEGKLSLNDKLSKYYPNYPRAADITLVQMLHHTSGLHSYTDDASFLDGEAALSKTTDQWVEQFAKMSKTQDFEPGTSWNYSNTAYFMLGGVIEKVEGKPLATVLRDRLFTPLGLKATALDDERDIVPGRVEGYDGGEPGKFRNPQFISMTVPGGEDRTRRWHLRLQLLIVGVPEGPGDGGRLGEQHRQGYGRGQGLEAHRAHRDRSADGELSRSLRWSAPQHRPRRETFRPGTLRYLPLLLSI